MDKNLRTINAPLDCLVTAASFRIFGVSTWAGRFPYVLAGLVSLLIFILLLRHDFADAPWLQNYAFACLAGSVNFLLTIRTCRYYALSLLSSLLIYYAYKRCLTNGHNRYFIMLAAASILSFYSNYLLCGAFLLALVLNHFIFQRRDPNQVRPNQVRRRGGPARKFMVVAVLFVAATGPYAVRYKAASYPAKEAASFAMQHRVGDLLVVEQPQPWHIAKPTLLWWNLRESNLIGCLPWTVALGLLYLLWRHRRDNPVAGVAREWFAFALGYIFFLSLFSPQPLENSDLANIRFLLPVMPFLAGLSGVFLWFAHQRTKMGALVLLAIYLNTNLLTLNPRNDEFRWLLPAYLSEVHQPYPTAYSEVSGFLRQHARQDDMVFSYPDYTNYPILFYSGDRVKVSCLLDYRTPLPHSVIRSLKAPLFIEENFPHWLVAFSFEPHVVDLLKHFSRAHREQGRMVYYPYRLVRLLDVPSWQAQRPELPSHSFGPP